MSGLRSVGHFCYEIYRTYVVKMPNNFAASLSYYSLFSLVPTIYIAFLIAGIFIDDKAAMQYIFTKVENILGAYVAKFLMHTLEGISQDPSNRAIVDIIVSFSAILLSASLVFFKLQYALNTLWKIPPASKGQTKILILNRLISFLMVFCVGILILVITISYVMISFFDTLLQLQISIPFLNMGTNWVIYTAAIALLFKLLPDARISWKDALIGAGVTAFLLSAGSKMLGWYLAKGSVGSAFEAAGTVAVLLIAIYFLAQFFIFGVVFTRVFSKYYGRGIHPRKTVES